MCLRVERQGGSGDNSFVHEGRRNGCWRHGGGEWRGKRAGSDEMNGFWEDG